MMIRFSKIFRRVEPQEATPDFFDIYHERTMTALVDSRGLPFGQWSMADGESLSSAARLILGLLRSRRELRRKFPRAVTGTGEYRDWLVGEGARSLKLPDATVSNIKAAFPTDPGGAVREFYLHTPEVQWRYPLGLLPVGQKRFAKWLVGKGRAQHGCSDEQILWFLHATAEDLPRHIALTYLINPDWQQRFLKMEAEGRELIRWLRREFPKYRPLRRLSVLSIPNAAPEIETNDLTGVNILSHFCYASGIREAAAQAKAALETSGLRTSCRDVPSGVRTELSPREEWLGFERFPITITNVAPQPHFESRYRRAGLATRKDAVQVAYWAWELETVPDEWTALAELLDEIWAPTPFVAEAMRAKLRVPVYDVLPGVSLGEVEEMRRSEVGIRQSDFVFLFMFDMCSDFRRKNPLAVVRAFQQAFGDDHDVRLVVKVSRSSNDPDNFAFLRAAAAGGNIVIVDEFVSRAKAYGYIAMSDCVVSLHRSEGFGLLMAEAMLLGKPVIATDYSGNTAFMNRENSLLVDYDMATIEESGAIYKAGNRWAEPSVDHAARLMRQVFEEREEAKALGARGKADAQRLLAPAAAGERMKTRLAELRRCSRDR